MVGIEVSHQTHFLDVDWRGHFDERKVSAKWLGLVGGLVEAIDLVADVVAVTSEVPDTLDVGPLDPSFAPPTRRRDSVRGHATENSKIIQGAAGTTTGDHGKVLQSLLRNGFAHDSGSFVDRARLPPYFDGLSGRAQPQLKIHVRRVPGQYRDIFAGSAFEAGLAHGDAIRSNDETREAEIPACSGCGCKLDPGGGIPSYNLRSGYCGAGRVCHRSRDPLVGRSCRLAIKRPAHSESQHQ